MLHGNGVSPARGTSDKAKDDQKRKASTLASSDNEKKLSLLSVPRRMGTPRAAYSIRTDRSNVPGLQANPFGLAR